MDAVVSMPGDRRQLLFEEASAVLGLSAGRIEKDESYRTTTDVPKARLARHYYDLWVLIQTGMRGVNSFCRCGRSNCRRARDRRAGTLRPRPVRTRCRSSCSVLQETSAGARVTSSGPVALGAFRGPPAGMGEGLRGDARIDVVRRATIVRRDTESRGRFRATRQQARIRIADSCERRPADTN